jgi:putative ABC transport system substrate-binding protein
MVIYPRASSAYDVAMTTLLLDFAQRPVNLRFLAVTFDRDPARGAALLAEAAAEGHALIYAMGSETVAWLHDIRETLATPVVTVCAKDPVLMGQVQAYDGPGGGMIAYTSLNPALGVQIAHLTALRPGLRSVGVLVDRRNLSAVETQADPIIAALAQMDVDAFAVAVENPADARAELEAGMPKALARMRARDPDLSHSLFWITGSTSVFAEIETLVSGAGPVPLVAAAPEIVRAGPFSAATAVGVSFESNAHLAAVWGAAVLEGRAPGEMPVGVVSPPDVALNFLRLRAAGLRVPFAMLEAAAWVYDAEGRPARLRGRAP